MSDTPRVYAALQAEVGDPESMAVYHLARTLERELADAKSDVLRLHREKMDLWEKLNFPPGPSEEHGK